MSLKDKIVNPKDITDILNETLNEAYEGARERSLSNLITQFGSSAVDYFALPGMHAEHHPPNELYHFGIPKWLANRYAKIWIVMFPARVNYLVKRIKTNADTIAKIISSASGTNAARLPADLKNALSYIWNGKLVGKGIKVKETLAYLINYIDSIARAHGDKNIEEKARALIEDLREIKERYLEGPISKVFIQGVSRPISERFSVFLSAAETIPFLQFFGSNVIQIQIDGIMPNSINLDGKNTMIKAWIKKLRGSALLAHWQVAVLDYEDTQIYFYPFSINLYDTSDGAIRFSMGAVVTRMTYNPLIIPGTAERADDLDELSRGELMRYKLTDTEIARAAEAFRQLEEQSLDNIEIKENV